MSDAWQVVLTGCAGVATGVLSAMFGVGGATLSTPAIRAIGASPLDSVGSTLPSILPSAVSGSLRYRREGLVVVNVAAWTALAGVVAAVGGSFAADAVPGGGHPLMIATALLLAVTAVRTARPLAGPPHPPPDPDAMPFVATEDEPARGAGSVTTAELRAEPWRLVSIGIAAGTLSGLLGIGGGIVMVPAFTGSVRLPIKRAVATSLVCVGILAIPGTITHALLGNIDWRFALPLAAGVIPGARLGAALALRASDRTLRVTVALVLGSLAVAYGVGELLEIV